MLRNFTRLSIIVQTLFNYIGEERKGTLRYLDIDYELIESVLSSDVISDKKLKILWEDDPNPVRNIGSNTIKIYNFSDKDFEDVIVRVKITSTIGSEPNVLYSEYIDKDGLSKSIKAEPVTKENDGSLIYEYKISTVNRNYDLTPVFKAMYFYKDKDRLNLVAAIEKKGVEKRGFSLKHFDRKSLFEKYGPTTLIILLIGIYVAVIIILIIGVKRESKKLPVMYKERSEIVKQELKKLNVSANEEELTNFSIDVLHNLRFHQWKTIPSVLRSSFFPLFRKEPKKEELYKMILENSTNSFAAKKQNG